MKKIAIIGGGASGMMAAIVAAREGAQVTIFEKNDRIGKKILATGNGKCNFGNLLLGEEHYRSSGQANIMSYINKFTVEDSMEFFQQLGMLIKEKNNYLYPLSEQASTVLDLLRMELCRLGVTLHTEIIDLNIKKQKDKTFVITYKGVEEKFQSVILCSGSVAGEKSSQKPMTNHGKQGGKQKVQSSSKIKNGYDYAKELGHAIVPVVPALVQLRCEEDFFKGIAGVRTDANLILMIDGNRICQERGELQLTDYGISGIPVFQLSRYASYGIRERKIVEVHIDFFPSLSSLELQKVISQRYDAGLHKSVEDFFVGLLSKKLCVLAIKLAHLKGTKLVGQYEKCMMIDAVLLMKEVKVHVVATNPYENAQICAGGVSMDEVSESLESNIVPHLYLAGEVLDVDGICGGYNLQWAWTSGYIAGKAATT